MATYGLLIEEVGVDDTAEVVNVTRGSIALVSYAAKDVLDILKSDGAYRVTLTQASDAFGEEGVSLLSIAADAGTMNDVLRVRLARLRKAEKAPASYDVETEVE